MDTCMECYKHVSAPNFNEWVTNTGINNDTPDVLYSRNSSNSSNSNTSFNCEEEKVKSTKYCKREIWSKQQTAVLVVSWKHLYKESKTFKQPSV